MLGKILACVIVCSAASAGCRGLSTASTGSSDADTDTTASSSGGTGGGLDGASGGPGACWGKACGDPCDQCEQGMCNATGAPHGLECNSAGLCQYISMTATPAACMGPIACGDGFCGDGFDCHCPTIAAQRCCPTGTECEPCGSDSGSTSSGGSGGTGGNSTGGVDGGTCNPATCPLPTPPPPASKCCITPTGPCGIDYGLGAGCQPHSDPDI